MATFFQPAICREFSCSADRCSYNCCHGWDIPLTAQDAAQICGSGEDREAMLVRTESDAGMGTYSAKMALQDHACPFLNGGGLCNLQVESGKRYLPRICTDFPLQYYRSSEVWEVACSPGCEEITRLLLQQKDGIVFESFETEDVQEDLHPAFPYDENTAVKRPLLQFYWDIKYFCLSVLTERSMPMDSRVLLLTDVLQTLYQLETEGRLDDTSAFLASCQSALDEGALDAPVLREKQPQLLNILHMAYVCCLPDTQEAWHPQIFQTLGIDAATGSVDWEKYLAETASRDAVLEDRAYLLENFAVCYFHLLALPFGDGSQSLWDNCLWFGSLYANLKFVLAATLRQQTDERAFFRTIAMFSRGFAHSAMRRDKVLENLKALELDTPYGLEGLIRE